VISTLAVGEALVSTLQEGGVPMPVQRTMMAPPRSRIGAITPEERAAVRARSPIGAKYDTTLNRESAYEMLAGAVGATGASGATGAGATGAKAPNAPRAPNAPNAPSVPAPSKIDEFLWGTKRRQGMVETMAKQTARTVGSQIGRQILRGVLGGILGTKRERAR
jgi:DNA helicase HerA-like ATPase